MLQSIKEYYPEEEFMTADGFDDAIIGFDELCSPIRIIYSVKKCIEILVSRDGMTNEEATEYFYFNCLRAYMGEGTPIWCIDNLSYEE